MDAINGSLNAHDEITLLKFFYITIQDGVFPYSIKTDKETHNCRIRNLKDNCSFSALENVGKNYVRQDLFFLKNKIICHF